MDRGVVVYYDPSKYIVTEESNNVLEEVFLVITSLTHMLLVLNLTIFSRSSRGYFSNEINVCPFATYVLALRLC